MTESDDAFLRHENVWDFIRENPKLLGLPISENKSLDILGALTQINECLKVEANTEARTLLDMLVTAMVSAVTGNGGIILEEIEVAEAMENFDGEVKKIFDEGR